MKTPYAIGLLIVSVLITVAIEESRIAALRTAAQVDANVTVAASRAAANAANAKGEETDVPARGRHRSDGKPAASVKAADTEDESLAKSVRRLLDNPAGKSMMNQQMKMMVGMTYQDFVDGLQMSKDEGEYFKNLLGKGLSDQQELSIKMMGASQDEQKTLADEIAKRERENEAEIKKFLNSDEDFKSFSDYKQHLPERQQLDGLRSAMTNKGVPLDPATETRLVDAMYRARTESKAPDLSGPGAITELAKGNLVESFEKNWDQQQATLQTEVGKFLSEPQLAAFKEQQKQMKDMQLIGLKMAETMMPGKKAGAQ